MALDSTDPSLASQPWTKSTSVNFEVAKLEVLPEDWPWVSAIVHHLMVNLEILPLVQAELVFIFIL